MFLIQSANVNKTSRPDVYYLSLSVAACRGMGDSNKKWPVLWLRPQSR